MYRDRTPEQDKDAHFIEVGTQVQLFEIFETSRLASIWARVVSIGPMDSAIWIEEGEGENKTGRIEFVPTDKMIYPR